MKVTACIVFALVALSGVSGQRQRQGKIFKRESFSSQSSSSPVAPSNQQSQFSSNQVPAVQSINRNDARSFQSQSSSSNQVPSANAHVQSSNHNDARAFQSRSGIPQAVRTGSFGQPQQQQYQQQQPQQQQFQQQPQYQQQPQQQQYQQQPQQQQFQQQQPQYNQPWPQPSPPLDVFAAPRPAAYKNPVADALLHQALTNPPAYAQLIAARTTTGVSLVNRLPSNATLIRPNIVEGFSCQGRKYGYYADTFNGCQIFHICYPLRDVFNGDPTVEDVTYDWAFICNEFTIFSQDSKTCAWKYEAVQCENAEKLYFTNEEFFKTTVRPAGQYAAAAMP